MTEFVVRLRTDNPLTKHEAYAQYGNIADVCSNLELTLVSITDDVSSAPAEPPAVKTRKPRGPNKAKVKTGYIDMLAPGGPAIVPTDVPHPGFLKCGA